MTTSCSAASAGDERGRAENVEQRVRARVRRERDERDAAVLDSPARDVALASRVPDAGLVEDAHRFAAAVLAEVARVVVGEAHDVEARVDQVLHVARRSAEEVAELRVLADLEGLAAVAHDALEVAEGDVRRAQDGRRVREGAGADRRAGGDA